MALQLHVAAWAAWAPGRDSAEAWRDWAGALAAGAEEAAGGLELSAAAPPLVHLDAMFKRRLSQLSRMILQVGHELAGGQEIDTVFASRYGEVGQQYKISRNLIESGEVTPAAFSLSVFNTPVALLSIAEKNHRRGSALYGGEASFCTALLEALALTGRSGEPVLVLCGDEALPEDWRPLAPGPVFPHAVGLLLSPGAGAGTVSLSVEAAGSRPLAVPPGDGLSQDLRFLAWFLGGRAQPLELFHRGFGLVLSGAA
jgi:hypothetical protein